MLHLPFSLNILNSTFSTSHISNKHSCWKSLFIGHLIFTTQLGIQLNRPQIYCRVNTGFETKKEVWYPEGDLKTVEIPGDWLIKIHPCTTVIVMFYHIVYMGMQRFYLIMWFYFIYRPYKKHLAKLLTLFNWNSINNNQWLWSY